MKKIIKTLCLATLLLVCAIAPLLAQSETTNETNPGSKSDNAATSVAPQAPSTPQNGGSSQTPPAEVGQAISNVLESCAIIVAIVMPFACIVAVAGLIFKARRRRIELLHETLRAMIDKGVPIPPELLAPPKPQFTPPQSPFNVFASGKKSDLRSGLIMVALGFGLLFFFHAMEMKIWPVGFIFILLGFALLLVHRFEKKDAAKAEVAPK